MTDDSADEDREPGGSEAADDGASAEVDSEDWTWNEGEEKPAAGSTDEPESVDEPDDEPSPEAAEAAEKDPVVVPASEIEDDDGGLFSVSNLTGLKSQLGEAKEAFSNARGAGGLPTDDENRVRIVCRRYAERRLVALDDQGRPACFDADHPDCQGCLEDVRDGAVETW